VDDYRIEAIDNIIQSAIQVMDNSHYQIFEICEGARKEHQALKQELGELSDEIARIIDSVDRLERDFRHARIRLTEVSRDFSKYTEKDIETAYENATRLLAELMVQREKETHLKERREDIRKRIRNLEKTIERGESVMSQIRVVHQYLAGDLGQVTRILESARNRQMIGLKIIVAQEEERKRIAREIHDGLAQTLANVILRTEIVERMVGAQPEQIVRDEISELKCQVRAGLEEVRKMIFHLRPMALDDLGLIPALRKFVQDFEEKYRITTEFAVSGQELRLPSAMEVAIYRFVQEAFNNIHKHAEATFARLEVSFRPDEVELAVSDNGVGFRPEQAESRSFGADHFGLIGMRERIELLEGEFSVDSAPGQGTRVKMRVPYKPVEKME